MRTVGIIGTGVIGAGWAARFLARGLDVVAWDPGAGAEATLRGCVDNAWPALGKLGLFAGADRARLRFAADLQRACAEADFIQESAPEREALKRALHAEIDSASAPDVIVASSSSGLLPTHIQSDCARPDKVVIGHPFNPVYLLPLVEVLGGEQTSAAAIAAAIDFYRAVGMHPLEVRSEVEGYLSDRLQEALWRENLHLVNDGVATTAELDDAIIYGPGLRWAFMGVNKTFHLAGGASGMRHMLEQFGPALELPWTKLEAPELTDALIERLVEGTSAQAAGESVQALERLRDECLIAIMRALKNFKVGAGEVMARDDACREAALRRARFVPGVSVEMPLHLYHAEVIPAWLDYNDHMTDAAYLTAFAAALEALLEYVGCDEGYRAQGLAIFTAETHLRYHRECRLGDRLRFTVQLLGLDEKRLHIFQSMFNDQTGDLLCTAEQMLLHVDTTRSKSAPMRASINEPLTEIMKAHAAMALPDDAGRHVTLERSTS